MRRTAKTFIVECVVSDFEKVSDAVDRNKSSFIVHEIPLIAMTSGIFSHETIHT